MCRNIRAARAQVTLDEAPGGAPAKEERAWFYYNSSDMRDCVLGGGQEAPGFLQVR